MDNSKKALREEALIQIMIALRSSIEFLESMARSLHNIEKRGVVLQLDHIDAGRIQNAPLPLVHKYPSLPKINPLTRSRRRDKLFSVRFEKFS